MADETQESWPPRNPGKEGHWLESTLDARDKKLLAGEHTQDGWYWDVPPEYIFEHMRAMACESKETKREQCGLVLRPSANRDTAYREAHRGPDEQWGLHEITNVASGPNQFNMGRGALLNAYAQFGDAVVGCYHTHWQDDPKPSDADVLGRPQLLRYWIATVHGVYEWKVDPPSYREPLHRWLHVGG